MLLTRFSSSPVVTPHRDDESSLRIGETVSRMDLKKLPEAIAAAKKRGKLVMVVMGEAQDVGVQLNGGRPGAASGPDAIRSMFYAFQDTLSCLSTIEHLSDRVALIDVGDVACDELAPYLDWPVERIRDSANRAQVQSALGVVQKRAGEVVSQCVSAGADMVVALGGGHDTIVGVVAGLCAAQGSAVSVLNVDPHCDCRLHGPNSGSGFRDVSESIGRGHYAVLGMRPANVSVDQWQFMREHDYSMVEEMEILASPNTLLTWYERLLQKIAAKPHRWVATMDMDAVAGIQGVSAAYPIGLSPNHMVMISRLAGSRLPRIFHIAECWGGASAGMAPRLAALMVYEAMAGFVSQTI